MFYLIFQLISVKYSIYFAPFDSIYSSLGVLRKFLSFVLCDVYYMEMCVVTKYTIGNRQKTHK